MGTAAQLQLGSYSTSEQLTREKWIDGRPIYKKTIDFGLLPNNTTKNVAHGISGLDRVVDIRGGSKRNTTSLYVPLPGLIEVTGAAVRAYIIDSNLVVSSNLNMSNDYAYFTIWYIKS